MLQPAHFQEMNARLEISQFGFEMLQPAHFQEMVRLLQDGGCDWYPEGPLKY